MILESAAVGPFFKNGYVVGCERTRKAVFIDPGDEVEQLLDFIRKEELHVMHILLTHAHVDHVSGVAEAKRALGSPVYLHKDDLFLYDNAVRTGMMFGLTVEQPPIRMGRSRAAAESVSGSSRSPSATETSSQRSGFAFEHRRRSPEGGLDEEQRAAGWLG